MAMYEQQIQLRSNQRRYLQFMLLLLAAGAIYPILYLRQNFETTILSSFNITSIQLGEFYTILGIVYALTYLPSGWLADKFSPKFLIAFSLFIVGGLGFWFSTFPRYESLRIIFLGWGIAAGLTFWASLIKAVKLLAYEEEQGRFFGILDGGRGLVEAILASIAIALFAYKVDQGITTQLALQNVIYLYAGTCIVISVFVYMFLDHNIEDEKVRTTKEKGNLWKNIKILLLLPQVWLMTFIIFFGYQLFWATYSFSAYLQEGYGLTAIAAGVITVTKLWMRPIGGIGGGFLGDKFSKEGVLSLSLVLASIGLLALAYFPSSFHHFIVLGLVLFIGVLTYAIRGLYWSLLDSCSIPTHIVGLAIGFISMMGYLPDIFLPMINAYFSKHYSGIIAYKLYFTYIALGGFVGAALTLVFMKNITKGVKY
jgi:nitrate/nitrite transporter NarK